MRRPMPPSTRSRRASTAATANGGLARSMSSHARNKRFRRRDSAARTASGTLRHRASRRQAMPFSTAAAISMSRSSASMRQEHRPIADRAPECGQRRMRELPTFKRRQAGPGHRPCLRAEAMTRDRLEGTIALRLDGPRTAADCRARRHRRRAFVGHAFQSCAPRHRGRPGLRRGGGGNGGCASTRADGDSGGSSTPVAELNTTSSAARANRSVSVRAYSSSRCALARGTPAFALPRDRQQGIGTRRRRPSVG